ALFGVTGHAGAASPVPVPVPGRAAFQARMRAAFAADLPRRRAELRAALGAGDMEAAGNVLHGLRGSAAHLGAAGLVILCAGLEEAANAGRAAEVRAGLAGLESLLDSVEQLPA
ncbi:MAG: histidine kinase, partial [Massilia sp.]|nr:histidine kinase [Massilia sp.]